VSRALQVRQALLAHLDRGDRKEHGDEEGRKEKLETKEIKVLWAHREEAASKASLDLLGHEAKLELRDRKET